MSINKANNNKSTYLRPKTRGKLVKELQNGTPCEVVAHNKKITQILIDNWLKPTSYTVRPSENDGWVVFEKNNMVETKKEETMRVYKVTPVEGLNPCIEKYPEDVAVWLQEAEVGEKITVEIIEMSEKEFENLEEYLGP